MAKPITKPIADAAVKTRILKSFKGITGSAAKRSTKTNATAKATPIAAVK
jgi:hypothetical protein